MSRNIQFISGGLFARVTAPAVALMLASCQTTAQDSAAQGDAVPVETTSAAVPKPTASRKTTNVYTDPLVASAAASDTHQAAQTSAVPASGGAVAAYAPANLGELTMQPTTVNASRNSLFSQAPATADETLAPPAPDANAPAGTQALADGSPGTSTSIVVPSELPTRQVNPMSKSLFSAELRQPEPTVIEEAALPVGSAGEPPVYSAEEQPVYDDPAAAAQPVVENEQQVAQAAPAAAAEPEQPKKRKWLASLKAIFGKKKD